MIDTAVLPHVMAALNLSTFGTLVAGYLAIRSGRKRRHKACMLGAVALALAFFVVYFLFHLDGGTQIFEGMGTVCAIFFVLLTSHILLAMVALVMVPATLVRALRGRFDRHRRLARRILPVWLYVSASGVAVYLMAFHI